MVNSDFDQEQAPEADKTQPPMSALRYATPFELYQSLTQVQQMTQHRPREDETSLDYLMRLGGSTTPEEAVTFTAYAALPKMAIWWGYECVRTAGYDLSPAERGLMELVANWTTYPDNENRFRAMQAGLFAPVRSPAVYLALAVGWSGGAIAPNDPAPVPLYRAPRAINTAVLSCLAKSDLAYRPVRLARFIEQAVTLMRVY